jgi:AcrR family transcriptional regulator
MPRKYDLTLRAAQQEATRRRIVEAAVALHRTVGPARTEISAVAALAGVERVTVYRHFPEPKALLSACSEHYRELNPPPDPGSFRRIRDPRERAAAGLDAAFAYYEANEQMMANVLRDAAMMPVGAGFLAFQQTMAETLSAGWAARGRRRTLLRAALRLAVDFHAWQRLARGAQGLRRSDAVEVMLGMLDGVG